MNPRTISRNKPKEHSKNQSRNDSNAKKHQGTNPRVREKSNQGMTPWAKSVKERSHGLDQAKERFYGQDQVKHCISSFKLYVLKCKPVLLNVINYLLTNWHKNQIISAFSLTSK